MATKDLSSSDIKTQEELEDVTTCCICTEVYTDPKALPCIHTFCMKCLQETGVQSNKGPGDEMPCPICRRMFKIPSEGFRGLSKNFFIERLIQVSRLTDPSAVAKALCSVCLEEGKEQTGTESPTADAYCVDCKHSFCADCCNEHGKFKLTKKHKLMPINEYESHQNLKADLATIVCEVHAQRFVDVYCADCKTVVCAICFIEEHKNHEGSHVSKCVDIFRKQIESNCETMNGCISQAHMKKAELMMVKEQIQKRVGSLESDIVNRKRQIIKFADKHTSSLLQGLCYERQSRLKEIQMATDDIDAYLSNLESYNSYCQRITDKGSASDICSALSDLSVRACELQQQCQPLIERVIQDFKFYFRQSDLREFREEDCGNLIGEVEKDGDLKTKKTSKQSLLPEQSKKIDILRLQNDQLRHELDAQKAINYSLRTNNDKFVEELNLYKATVNTLENNPEKLRKEFETTKAVEFRIKSDPVLVQTIRVEEREGDNKVWIKGLTILGKELFFVSENSPYVEVYDLMKFSFSRRWILYEPVDIGSCNRNKCLYILEFTGESSEIRRVDTNGKLINIWETGDDIGFSLCVTDESNVILTVSRKNKLNEYSPDGQLIRETNLSSNAGTPWRAIKLTNGHFVVSHCDDSLHRVCILDGDGKLKKSFGGVCGSTIEHLHYRVDLTVDGNGFVMVADQRNSRVLLLDSDLEFKRVILSKETHGLRHPWRILLDESNGRMFVTDHDIEFRSIRILIFDFN